MKLRRYRPAFFEGFTEEWVKNAWRCLCDGSIEWLDIRKRRKEDKGWIDFAISDIYLISFYGVPNPTGEPLKLEDAREWYVVAIIEEPGENDIYGVDKGIPAKVKFVPAEGGNITRVEIVEPATFILP